jgi:hypothetical protein
MGSDISAADFLGATVKERIAKSRHLADEAKRIASTKTGEARATFTRIAEEWTCLADEMESIAAERV